MIYVVALCIRGACSVVMGNDAIPDGVGSIADRCLQWTAVLNGNLGTARGPDYEFRCLSRAEPWQVVR